MPQAVLEIVASDTSFDRLPFSLEQKTSRSSALILLLLLVPALAMLLVPVALVATLGASTLGVAAAQPVATAQVLFGLALWTVLFGLPAKRIIKRFGTARAIRIDARGITVTESGPFRAHAWTAPLSEFSGIAHHVRSTLSGLRHELILVHAVRERCVLIHTAGKVSKTTIEHASALLRLPEVPARDLYRLSRRAAKPSVVSVPALPTTQPS